MAYRYNNGRGAITCDRCRIIICTGDKAVEWANEDTDEREDLCEKCSLLMDGAGKCTIRRWYESK